MKKLLIALLAMGFASYAQAAYLYWQVSEDAVTEFASGEGAYGVQVKYGDTVLNISDLNGVDTGKTRVNVGAAQDPGYLINISGLDTGLSFYIEIVKWNQGTTWNTVAVSQGLEYTSYADINAYTVDLNAVAPALPAQVWAGGSYAAPEPTTGLLMLFGLAGLALKRRKI